MTHRVAIQPNLLRLHHMYMDCSTHTLSIIHCGYHHTFNIPHYRKHHDIRRILCRISHHDRGRHILACPEPIDRTIRPKIEMVQVHHLHFGFDRRHDHHNHQHHHQPAGPRYIIMDIQASPPKSPGRAKTTSDHEWICVSTAQARACCHVDHSHAKPPLIPTQHPLA